MRSALVPVVLAVLLVGAACGPKDTTSPSAVAEHMWRRLQKEPGLDAYTGFVEANKKAAIAHANSEDREGIEYQIRYADASADQAVRAKNEILADEVFDMVVRLRNEGNLDDYEQLVPGVKQRLDAAEAKVRPILRRSLPQK